MTIATQMGATDTYGGDDFDATDAFLERAQDAAKPSKRTDEEEDTTPEDVETPEPDDTEESTDESPEDEPEADGDEETEGDDEDEESSEDDDKEAKRKPNVITDENTVVKVTVDGKELDVSVKDLKRLYGQEASLTRKSQEVAAEKKRIAFDAEKNKLGLEEQFKRAQERFKPYAELDWVTLMRDPNLDDGTLKALRDEAEKARSDLQFYGETLDKLVKDTETQRIAKLQDDARACLKELTDPKTGIEGWDNGLYDNLRTFAVTNGMEQDVVNELVSPQVFKLLHKAYLYDKGQKASVTKTQKVNGTPKKVIKSTSEAVTKQVTKGSKDKDAMARLKRSGSQDDAEAVFMSRASRSSD